MSVMGAKRMVKITYTGTSAEEMVGLIESSQWRQIAFFKPVDTFVYRNIFPPLIRN